MYVVMKVSAAGARFSLKPGDVVEITDYEGQRLIDKGYADLFDEEVEEEAIEEEVIEEEVKEETPAPKKSPKSSSKKSTKKASDENTPDQ